MTQEATTLMRGLGGYGEFSDISHFLGGHGVTSTKVGGLWGGMIPEAVLEEMFSAGYLGKKPNGNTFDYVITPVGRRECVRLHYGFIEPSDA